MKKSPISPEIHALASQLKDLQAKARALGMFDNSRELVRCSKCGLEEDVTIEGLLITTSSVSTLQGAAGGGHAKAWTPNTGLRFAEKPAGTFRCPVCKTKFAGDDEGAA